MAVGNISFRVNQSGMARLLTDARGPVVLHIANLGREVRGKWKACVPKVSHDLEKSIDFKMVRQARGWTAEVTAEVPYASWIEDGKRFDPRSGRTIFVKVGPRPCGRKALNAVKLFRSRRTV